MSGQRNQDGQSGTDDQLAASLAATQAALANLSAEAEAEELEDIDDKSNDPAYLREGIRKVHKESKERRLVIKELKATVNDLKGQLAERDAKQAELQKAKLAEEGNLKELLAQEQAEKRELMLTLQGQAVELTLENKLRDAGIDKRFAKLVDRNGVFIDKTGKVQGMDEAIERFKTANADLIESVKGKNATGNNAGDGQDQTQADPEKKPNPADRMYTGGTFATYGDMNKLHNAANAGKNPKEAGVVQKEAFVPVNQLPKTKEGKKQADKALSDYMASLANK